MRDTASSPDFCIDASAGFLVCAYTSDEGAYVNTKALICHSHKTMKQMDSVLEDDHHMYNNNNYSNWQDLSNIEFILI